MPYLQLFPLRAIAWLKRVPLVITWNEVWGRDRWRSYIGRLGFVAAFIFLNHIQREPFTGLFKHTLGLLGLLENLGDLPERGKGRMW